MNSLYNVKLMPIEPILFSDNRSAREGADHLIRDQDPSPHAIYGAIGAYIAKQLGATIDSNNWQKAEEYLGKFNRTIESDGKDRAELWGYCLRDADDKLWFPKPKHVFFKKDKFPQYYPTIYSKLVPCSLTDFNSLITFANDPNDNELETEVLIKKSLLGDLLCFRPPVKKANEDVCELIEFYRSEMRLGIGMDNPKNTTKEGLFFSRPYRRFKPDFNLNEKKWQSVGFSLWYKTLKALNGNIKLKGLCFLGGDRRRAVIEFAPVPKDKPLNDVCTSVQAHVSGTQGFLAYLLTPAVREENWPKIENQTPIAACIGKEITISGWNSDRSHQHPRPILKLIPAGSTFFYEWPSNDLNEQKRIIFDNWFKPASDNYKNSGFGRVLIGVWK